MENKVNGAEITFPSNNAVGKTFVNFDTELLAADSADYSHELCVLSAQLMMLSYKIIPAGFDAPEAVNDGEGIFRALSLAGLDRTEHNTQTGRFEENYLFASGKTVIGGEEKTLVFVSLIGSRLGQWYTNFDSGTGAVHKGFADAENFIYNNLKTFIAGAGAEKEDIKLLITGHSRGAATANLLAAQLIREEDIAKKENIFTYTFATPSATSLEERKAPEYKRIFNIVNDEDFVTKCMPEAWGYGRYGRTVVLPDKSNTENYAEMLEKMNSYYSEFVPGDRYAPFKDGPATVNKLYKAIVSADKNIYEFCFRKFRCPKGQKMSVQSYFFRTLCAITGEIPGSKEAKDGTSYMLATTVLRAESSPVIKAVADFFVIYEGLAGATDKKFSDTYFSYSHSMDTYCAFIIAAGEDGLIFRD